MSNHNDNKSEVHLEEGEKHLLLDHNYDGIHELDHPLPTWWQYTFYGGIIFAVLYFILFQIMGAPSLRDEFKKEFAKIQTLQEQFTKKNGAFDEVK